MSEMAKHWIGGEWTDSCAAAASFRKDGAWTVRTESGAEPFQV